MQSYFKFGPVVQEMLLKEKVYREDRSQSAQNNKSFTFKLFY